MSLNTHCCVVPNCHMDMSAYLAYAITIQSKDKKQLLFHPRHIWISLDQKKQNYARAALDKLTGKTMQTESFKKYEKLFESFSLKDSKMQKKIALEIYQLLMADSK